MIAPPVRVLLVCTANQGRSAMAEALMRARLRDWGLEGAVTVGSAGLMEGGVPASEPVREAVRALGGDLGHHLSRRLTEGLVHEADLVIGMATEHAQRALELHSESGPPTFTLKELVRLAERGRPRRTGEPLGEYLTRLAAARDRLARAETSAADDIEDPYGRPVEAVLETAGDIDELLQRLLQRLWPRTGSVREGVLD